MKKMIILLITTLTFINIYSQRLPLLEKELLKQLNQYRKERNLPIFERNPNLDKLALAQAEYLKYINTEQYRKGTSDEKHNQKIIINKKGHKYQSFQERYDFHLGYFWEKENMYNEDDWALETARENLILDPNNNETVDVKFHAKEFIKVWDNSPGHKRTMLVKFNGKSKAKYLISIACIKDTNGRLIGVIVPIVLYYDPL